MANVCKYCPKGFFKNSDLKTHERTHTGEKPFVCQYCPKAFSESGTLKAHERRHVGEKPFQCQYCPKAFTTSGYLKTHERTHTGEKPHWCQYCPKAFARSSDRNKPERRIHPAEMMHPCQICELSFRLRTSASTRAPTSDPGLVSAAVRGSHAPPLWFPPKLLRWRSRVPADPCHPGPSVSQPGPPMIPSSPLRPPRLWPVHPHSSTAIREWIIYQALSRALHCSTALSISGRPKLAHQAWAPGWNGGSDPAWRLAITLSPSSLLPLSWCGWIRGPMASVGEGLAPPGPRAAAATLPAPELPAPPQATPPTPPNPVMHVEPVPALPPRPSPDTGVAAADTRYEAPAEGPFDAPMAAAEEAGGRRVAEADGTVTPLAAMDDMSTTPAPHNPDTPSGLGADPSTGAAPTVSAPAPAPAPAARPAGSDAVTTEGVAPASSLPSVYAASEVQETEEQTIYEAVRVRMPYRWRVLTTLLWYHGPISRHVAQALLMQNGVSGSYLLRELHTGEMCVSARSIGAVKHFKMHFSKRGCTFGKRLFKEPQELIRHFDKGPTLGGATGVLTTLTHPYPKNVPEFATYEPVRMHSEWGSVTGGAAEDSNPMEKLSTTSREGYLTKLGRIHKTWKPRWFILYKDTLKYFRSRDDTTPIRSINLTECTEAGKDARHNKSFCFYLRAPHRTFYMYASDEQDADEWLALLKWKLSAMGNMSEDAQVEEGPLETAGSVAADLPPPLPRRDTMDSDSDGTASTSTMEATTMEASL